MFYGNGVAAFFAAVILGAASVAVLRTAVLPPLAPAATEVAQAGTTSPPPSHNGVRPAKGAERAVIVSRQAHRTVASAPRDARPEADLQPQVPTAPTTRTLPSDIAAATTAAPRAAAPDIAEAHVTRVMYCHLDSRGALGASEVLQDCVDRAPAFSSVEIPPGTYALHRQVVVTRPVVIRTAGTANTSISCAATPDRCAILMAAPDFFAPLGLLLVHSASNVTLEHLVVDGNRAARLSSAAARSCQSRGRSPGFNASVLGCARCALDDVVSRNALCGSGMVWSGEEAVIRRSEFRGNGDAGTARMWADGLTLLYAPDSDVRGNRFIDNSDIGLIVGHGARSRIEQNVVVQHAQEAFAGLMLDNFDSNHLDARGDFRGAVIAGNTVDCGPDLLCVYGIQVGSGPWYAKRNIFGGEVRDNEIRGAKIGINVDGAGVRLAPTAVYANRVSGVPADSYFRDCSRVIPTGWMNIAPTSVVDRREETVPTTAHLSNHCQLWSGLSALRRPEE